MIFSPSVLTSNKAQQDFDKIKSEHSNILMGIADHRTRMEQQNQVKAQQLASDNSMRNEIKKAEITANTEIQKQTMANDMKRAELEIKRIALSAV